MDSPNRSTLARLLAIALPMVVSQASDTVMMFTNRLFLSRLGEVHMAAAMSGGLTEFMFTSFFVGLVGYVGAIVAQYYGAARRDRCAAAVGQAVLLALACYPLLLLLAPLARPLFLATGQDPLQAALADEYFRTLILGSVFLVLRFAVTGFFLGIGRTRVVMLANLSGMAVNVPASWLLIHGRLGLPPLGMRGAALATVLGNLCALLILLAFYLRRANRREYGTHRAWRPRADLLRRLLRFGSPAGAELLLNVAAFNLFVQFMHGYGPDVAAAVTIAFNWDVVAFIPMLGMGYAATAVVGQSIGAGNIAEARRSTWTALRVAWVYSGSMVLLFLSAAPRLVGVFASGFAGGGGEVASLAEAMLRLASIYILADSAQIVFTGALRGAGDTAWVMRASVGLHWLLAASAVLLIRVVRVGPLVAWLSFIGFVVLLGLFMFARFRGGRWQGIRLIDREPPPVAQEAR